MSKLHIYRKVNNTWTKQADGTGTISKSESFGVTITKWSVSKGETYQIRKGQQHLGDLFHCTTGAEKGGTAQFDFAGEGGGQELVTSYQSFSSALAAVEKKVTIEIAMPDLETLKGSNYRLCFAKKVGEGAYNVVWQSYHDYLVTNEFTWTPLYQLFGSNVFFADVTVSVSTNLVDIGLKQQSTLNEFGNLEKPVDGPEQHSITMINEYGSIHPGVSQLSTGIKGERISTPIYVAENSIVRGPTNLTPVEKVLVWFEQDIKTSTMFSNSRSNPTEIDLTNSNDETRLFEDQTWKSV